MHFLCLHGIGTNSHVFETQTATLRWEMDTHHTFEFVEGTEVYELTPELRGYFPQKDTYYRYFKPTAESLTLALDQLGTYLEEEGPFDGVMAFSHGCALATAYMLRLSRERPFEPPPFRCAIFLSSTRPFDVEALAHGEMKYLEPNGTTLLQLPTAHVWGRKDALYGHESEINLGICDEAQRSTYTHDLGHEVPGGRNKDDVQQAMRVIRRTIDMASMES